MVAQGNTVELTKQRKIHLNRNISEYTKRIMQQIENYFKKFATNPRKYIANE